MPPGQPTMLTPQVIEDVKRILPTVLYMETVGDYIGVHRTTWRGWLKRGAVESRRMRKKGAKPRPTEALYLQFFDAVKKAMAEGEIHDAGVIKKAASEQWQAAAWRLERRFPPRWAKTERLEHTGKDGKPIQQQMQVLSWDDLYNAKRPDDPIAARIAEVEKEEEQ